MNRIGFGPTCEIDRYALGGFRISVAPFFVVWTRLACETQAARPRSVLVESLPFRFGCATRCDALRCIAVNCDTLWCVVMRCGVLRLVVESFPTRFGRIVILIHLRCGCSEDE